MLNINSKFTDVLIIGNGFDIDLGLLTKYSDFIKSIPSNVFITNELLSYIKETEDLNGWVDIERELAVYSNRILSRNEFKRCYRELCKELIWYLKTAQKIELNKESLAYQLMNNLINNVDNRDKSTLILDFNYTNSMERILKDFDDATPICHVKVHGAVESNIIFGVQDSAEYDKEYPFLLKSSFDNAINFDLSGKLKAATNITIFGHSLGESDHHYFYNFFNKHGGFNGKNTFTRKLDIYCYSSNDRDRIVKNLYELTGAKLAELRINRKLRIVSTEDFYRRHS